MSCRRWLPLRAAVSALPATAYAQALPYDLVILNGRVIDPESGLDAVRSMGIREGKITALSRGTLAGAK